MGVPHFEEHFRKRTDTAQKKIWSRSN